MAIPVKKSHGQMWALLAVAAIIIIIIAGVGYCVTSGSDDGGTARAEGRFTYSPSYGQTVTDNSIEFTINLDNREVEGECVFRIESDRSDDTYSKTTIVLIGTYTPSTTGGGGTIYGTATATYDEQTSGEDTSEDPKTSSWSADIDSSGDIEGNVGTEDFTAQIVSGDLDFDTDGGNGGDGEAEFHVSNLRLSPDKTINLSGTPMEDFTIYITVENTGDADGYYKPEMTVNSESVGGSSAGLYMEAGETVTAYSLVLAATQIETLYLVDLYDGDIDTTKYIVNVDGLSLTVNIK